MTYATPISWINQKAVMIQCKSQMAEKVKFRVMEEEAKNILASIQEFNKQLETLTY